MTHAHKHIEWCSKWGVYKLCDALRSFGEPHLSLTSTHSLASHGHSNIKYTQPIKSIPACMRKPKPEMELSSDQSRPAESESFVKRIMLWARVNQNNLCNLNCLLAAQQITIAARGHRAYPKHYSIYCNPFRYPLKRISMSYKLKLFLVFHFLFLVLPFLFTFDCASSFMHIWESHNCRNCSVEGPLGYLARQ